MNAISGLLPRVLFCTLAAAIASPASAQIAASTSSPAQDIPSLPPGAESWLGKYVGNGVQLEFRATTFGFTAVLKINGASNVANLRVDGERLTGTFGIGANAVPFEVTRQGSQLRLVSGSREFLLHRQGAASADLPKPGAPTAASTVTPSITAVTPPTARAGTAPAVDPNEPLADDTPLAQRWLEKLRGKLVRQFWASQGMSSDKRHMLAADGRYSYKSASMVSVDVRGASAMSTSADDTTGRWRIRDVSGQVYLEVRLNNGEMKRMRITQDNRNWYLNGEKAFAVDP